MTYSLSQKNILIVGATGRIGSATALASLKAGASVILSDICDTGLELLRSNLSMSYGGSVETITADVTDISNIDLLIEKSISIYGPVTSAVYSAYPRSAGWGKRLEELSQKDLNEDLSNQLGAAIMFSQKILRHFENNDGGDLVHISSIQGISAPKFEHYIGTDMHSPVEYSAIKAGIIAITKWLAKYYAHKSIRVNCVSPGGIRDGQPTSFIQKYKDSCSNYGMLAANQVADVIAFLLSEHAGAINGQNIVIDDGWSL